MVSKIHRLRQQRSFVGKFTSPFTSSYATKEPTALVVIPQGEKEDLVGMGQCSINRPYPRNCVSSKDDYQNQGVVKELLTYIIFSAKKQGVFGVTTENFWCYCRNVNRKQAHASSFQ